MPEPSRNLRRLGHLDLPGGGQVYVTGGYAYVGHMKPPHGTSIVDVRDPRNPRLVTTLMLADDRSHTHKVRVVGDLMVVNVEQNERHGQRRAARIPEVTAEFRRRHGRDPDDAELARAIRVQPDQLPTIRRLLAEDYEEGGFKIYDVADKARPRQIAYVRTHGFGTHRFDLDSRHAYISTEMAGYLGNILVIYDLADPARPAEVSRWWLPGQHLAGGETPTWQGYTHRLHHALRHGDQLFAAVWYAGCRVIDVADVTRPRTVASHDYHPPFPEPTHTFMRVPFPVGGRTLAVAVDEEHDHTPGQLHGGLWVFDLTEPDRVAPVGMWHLSELDSPFARMGRFGAHQFQEHMADTRLYTAWFGGGLRVVDIADPACPQEVAFFVPEPCGGQRAPQTNDVDVDERGLVYLIDRNVGFDILEPTA
jgi:hypothetical protein